MKGGDVNDACCSRLRHPRDCRMSSCLEITRKLWDRELKKRKLLTFRIIRRTMTTYADNDQSTGSVFVQSPSVWTIGAAQNFIHIENIEEWWFHDSIERVRNTNGPKSRRTDKTITHSRIAFIKVDNKYFITNDARSFCHLFNIQIRGSNVSVPHNIRDSFDSRL